MSQTKKTPTGLTSRQLGWTYSYAIFHDAKRALKDGGYKFTQSNCDKVLIDNLANPVIQNILRDIEVKTHGTQEEVCEQAKKVIAELDLISFVDLRKFYPPESKEGKFLNSIGDLARCIGEVEITEDKVTDTITRTTTKYKLHSKMKALELLGKHHKLYTELVANGGQIAVPRQQPYELPEKEE